MKQKRNMEAQRVLKIGFVAPDKYSNSTQTFLNFLSSKTNVDGQITMALVDFLIQHSKNIDRATYLVTRAHNVLIEYINQTKVDIAPQRYGMTDENAKRIDFAYPLKLQSITFATGKTQYKPHILGIFQTLSLSVWLTLVSVLISLTILYYIILRWKYSLDKVMLHVFAVLLRQNSMFKPSSVAENLLVYSWVVGAMYLCLAYDSVFLSFLTIPPAVKITDVSQLASAVANGDYNCVTSPGTHVYIDLLKASEHKYLRILGRDLEMNNLSTIRVLAEFYFDKSDKNLAFIGDALSVEVFGMGKKFVAKEPFLQSATAVAIRKNFSCKKLIEIFVHRFMASGLYCKYLREASFFTSLPYTSKYAYTDTKRQLSLIDVSPAFIFLLTGYLMSLLVFTVEVLLSHWKK